MNHVPSPVKAMSVCAEYLGPFARWGKRRLHGGLANAVLLGIALLIGTYNIHETGALFSDGPRYANGAAMIHDWLRSGELLHPYEFAKKNYLQYPAFSIPYHPPAYPGLLGLWFVLTGGVSHASARVFMALCLGLSSCFFFGILKTMGHRPAVAWACALLFLFIPEIAIWSRALMSEIPALLFILAGSYFFLSWLRTGRPLDCWVAFGLAEVAFLSRVTTAGILPGWFLFMLVGGFARRLRSPCLVTVALLYLSANVAWSLFVSRFSLYEVAIQNSGIHVAHLSWENASFYPMSLPALLSWGALLASLAGLAFVISHGKKMPTHPWNLFWLCWFVSYFVFQLALALNHQRYFVFALPGLAGFLACLFSPGLPRLVRRVFAPTLLCLSLITCAIALWQMPRGVVGYVAVAERLASLEEPGNVLVASWEDPELIFRFRALGPPVERRLIRSDRALAVRVSPTVGVPAESVADSPEDVLEVIEQGRVRYLVTCYPADHHDYRTAEMIVAHQTAASNRERFLLVGAFPLLVQFGGRGWRGEVFLWEYLGELPEGPSELPVRIPTADLTIEPES